MCFLKRTVWKVVQWDDDTGYGTITEPKKLEFNGER